MKPITPNIGPRGIARRRATGYLWIAISFAIAVASIVFHHPAFSLALLLTVSLGANGFLQAREKT